METQTAEQLSSKRCEACEGGVEKFSADEAREQLDALSGWELAEDAKHIQKTWKVKDFTSGMAFLNRVAEVAEQEDHHPDVCLEGYRNVRITLSTHAVGGLSQNDFILAAKIDELPVERKS